MQKHGFPTIQQDKGNAAILVIHVRPSRYRELSLIEKWDIRQPNVIYEPYTRYPDYEKMVKNTAQIIRKRAELPKIIVNYSVDSPPFCDHRILVVCNANKKEFTTDKKDAFEGTGLFDFLSEKKVTSVVVCGFSSTDCVQATAETGVHLGYTVITSLKLLAPNHPSVKESYPEKVIFYRRLWDLNKHLKSHAESSSSN